MVCAFVRPWRFSAHGSCCAVGVDDSPHRDFGVDVGEAEALSPFFFLPKKKPRLATVLPSPTKKNQFSLRKFTLPNGAPTAHRSHTRRDQRMGDPSFRQVYLPVGRSGWLMFFVGSQKYVFPPCSTHSLLQKEKLSMQRPYGPLPRGFSRTHAYVYAPT